MPLLWFNFFVTFCLGLGYGPIVFLFLIFSAHAGKGFALEGKKRLTATRLAASKTAVVGRLLFGSAMNVSVMTNDRINSMPNAWTGVTWEAICGGNWRHEIKQFMEIIRRKLTVVLPKVP